MTDAAISKPKILVVEDDLLIAWELEEIVLAAGYDVVGPVARIDEAMALARDAQIDAALLDIGLGDDEVFPAAMLLKARGIPFAFTTAHDGQTSSDKGFAEPSVRKPIGRPTVQKLLSVLMHGPAHGAFPANDNP